MPLDMGLLERFGRAVGEGYARVSGARHAPGAATAVAEPIEKAASTEAVLSPEEYQHDMLDLMTELRGLPFDPSFFFGHASRSGSRLDAPMLSKPFRRHPWLYAICSSIARNMTQPRFEVGYWKEGADRREEGAFVTIENSPIVDLFERPNRMLTGKQFWYLRALFMLLQGEAFCILDRDRPDQLPERMWLWPGGNIWQPSEERGDDGLPIGWVLHKGSEKVPFDDFQIIQWKFPNPYNQLRGMGPLDPARTIMESDVLADRYQKAGFENGSMPGGVISYPKPLTQAQYEQVKQRWEDRHRGAAKGHRVAILDRGLEYTPSAFSNRDMEFTEMRRIGRDNLLAVYGWPKWMVGATDELRESGAAAIAARETVWNENLIPLLGMAADPVEHQFLRYLPNEGAGRGNLACQFNTDDVPALVQARRARIEAAGKAVKELRMSPRQASKVYDLRMEPEPGDDRVLVPGTMVDIETIPDGTEPMPAPAPPPGPEPDEEPDNEPGTPEEPGEEEPEEPAETPAEEAYHAAVIANLKPSERASYQKHRNMWRRWNKRVMRPTEAMAQRTFGPYMRAMAKEILANFEAVVKGKAFEQYEARAGIDDEDIEKVLPDEEKWGDKLRQRATPLYQDMAEIAAAYTRGEMGRHVATDLLTPGVQEFLQQRVSTLSDYRGGINATVRRQLAASLAKGISEGESIPALRARIRAFGSALSSPARTAAIANTEAGVISSGIYYETGKEFAEYSVWVMSDDLNVRDSHVQAHVLSHQNPVRVGQPFPGVSGHMVRPKDPRGPAKEVVNCRCRQYFLPKEPV